MPMGVQRPYLVPTGYPLPPLSTPLKLDLKEALYCGQHAIFSDLQMGRIRLATTPVKMNNQLL